MTAPADEAEARRAEEELRRARERGQPVAKAILESFAKQFAKLAMHYAPGGVIANPHGDEGRYERWARLAADTAKALAPYEVPRLSTMALPPASPADERQVITLNVFETDRLGRKRRVEPGGTRYLDDPGADEPAVTIEAHKSEPHPAAEFPEEPA
jgi:hypothetical protein